MKKVAILGTVSLHRHLAPFEDADWDIWCCSPGNHGNGIDGKPLIPRVTSWFELHGTVDMMAPEVAIWTGPYFKWLREQSFEVWMQEPNEGVPNCKVFPIKALLREFGDLGRIAFTSSISMMIAFAIFQGATEIAVYGVDMAANEEAYSGQKSGCHIMIALAKQRGIKVSIPLESCLATMPPLYGYAEATRMGRRLIIKEQELQKGIVDLNATIERLTRDKLTIMGALDTIQYMRRTFVDGTDAELDLPSGEPAKMPEVEFGKFRLDPDTGVIVPKTFGLNDAHELLTNGSHLNGGSSELHWASNANKRKPKTTPHEGPAEA